MAVRTNALAAPAATPGKTNLATKQRIGPKTNAVAASQTPVVKLTTQVVESFNQLKGTKAYYPVIIGVPICLVLAIFFLARSIKSKKKAELAAVAELQTPSLAARPAKKMAKVHSCNVLEVGVEARHLWKFDADNGGFALSRQQTSLAGEPLPARTVAKDWRSLWQRKLNVAWLPSEQVFLRVAQFPRSDFNETLAMVELQLEKLSPMPVAQIVWSIQVLPHTDENLQTVVLMIVARNVVEEFLGQLEGQGYLADRLELPLLDQLQATAITEDGAWIYPQAQDGKTTALVAWWYGGVLQNLDLLTLPAVPQASSLKEQLLQMAWAGEMEGWLTAPPRWHLVADPATAA